MSEPGQQRYNVAGVELTLLERIAGADHLITYGEDTYPRQSMDSNGGDSSGSQQAGLSRRQNLTATSDSLAFFHIVSSPNCNSSRPGITAAQYPAVIFLGKLICNYCIGTSRDSSSGHNLDCCS